MFFVSENHHLIDPEQSIICRKVKGEKDEVYRGASTQILGVAVGDCYIMSTSGNDAGMLLEGVRNNNGLVSLNNELKTRLQAMDQQAQWGDGNSPSLSFNIHLFILQSSIMHV
uniref:Uncharacterized protein n=1 Tax=Oryza nivara TaxID=4536 RepID=A0A0E0FL68_ORYNI